MDRTRAGLDDETLGFVLQTLKTVTERRLDQETRLHLDEEAEFPFELVDEMLGPELGLHLLFLPEEVGGLGGGGRDLFRVSEEMARMDSAVATAFLAIALGVDPIIVGGTDEQKQHWLGRIAEEGLIVAYGVTEPEAGSNVANLKTIAEPITDEDGTITAYRIDGTKQFITNGGVAKIYTVLAKTPNGPSFFVIERDTPGFSVGAAGAQARHPRFQHDPDHHGRGGGSGGPSPRSRGGQGARAGQPGLRFHPVDGGGVRSRGR